ncbi:MAG: hypothetical protein GEU98_22430 [Pseudonocardiaceae bacterium]|nr:hypothetical protein [Pseudonocardiaceae bacterium]
MLASAAVVPQSAAAVRADVPRVEEPVASSSPTTSVAESVVRVKLPLPASAGPHPAECDWVSYLRYRHRDGPADSRDADKILIAQPGILEGAGAFDGVARNTIERSAEHGRYVEFWALDRRSNCLEDHTGTRAGQRQNDWRLAVDYYYRNREIDGRTFDGYLGNDQLGWLGRVGLRQTVKDQYDLMAAELPDPALRKEKALCGGHSLGGVLTGFFAVWDFDGNPGTTGDAGFNQCSGYFALDSSISTSLEDIGGQEASAMVPDPGVGYAATQAGLNGGVIPRSISLPALINAETMNVLGIAGLAANADPGGRSELVSYLPSNFNLETTTRLLFSKDLATFLTCTPSVQDFRLTNEAVLGGLLDDHSQPLAFLQTSVGFFDGGRIVDKDFPAPHDLGRIPGLEGLAGQFGTEPKAIPDEPNGPRYTWRNFDRIGAPDDPVYKTRNGEPFTDAGKEVTDIQQLARSLSEHPLDFTEQYFPTKLVTDIYQADSPAIAKHTVHRHGLTANPRITLLAGDGLSGGDGERPPGRLVIAPGYQHLDVLTASPTQNNGKREPVSTNLADFAR